MNGNITFLYHSGFIYENDSVICVFDYYQDPAGKLEKALQGTKKKVYFFVSHVHGDHFNPTIAHYESQVTRYIMHEDCHLSLQEDEKQRLMRPGDVVEEENVQVTMYGSTDVGGSFLVRGKDFSLFHAGDLNWWHWAGEPNGDNREARDHFFQELEQLGEQQVDIAFLPVDARQAVAREWGVKQFLTRLHPSLLIPMHAFGPVWVPSYEFRWLYPEQKLWIPQKAGETVGG